MFLSSSTTRMVAAISSVVLYATCVARTPRAALQRAAEHVDVGAGLDVGRRCDLPGANVRVGCRLQQPAHLALAFGPVVPLGVPRAGALVGEGGRADDQSGGGGVSRG